MKAIHCPECGSLAELNQHPHKDAGIWECTNEECGATDTCPHENLHIEKISTDYMRNGEIDQRDSEIYVCDDCNCAIPLDVANPAEDVSRALAMT